MHHVALTFDDGPDPCWTPRLLDVLDRYRITATFFVIAERAASCRALIQRMLGSGHGVGLHCDEHVRHSDRDRRWVESDTDRALAVLRDLDVRPKLWRTPWGVTAPWTAAVAAARDLELVHWTFDTHDWRGDSAAAMFARGREHLTPGAVVLAHDGIGPGARRRGVEETVAFTVLIAEFAQAHEMTLAALA